MGKARYNEIEQLVLENETKFDTSRYYNGGEYLDEAITIASKHGKNATLYDMVETYGNGVEWDEDRAVVYFLSNIVALQLDVDAIKASDANLLNPATVGDGWERGYQHALATYVAENGMCVDLNASYYGWSDWHRTTSGNNHIAAILSVTEDTWSEFQGTFYEGDTTKHGLLTQAVYDDGQCRFVRWEGNMTDLMKEIIKNAMTTAN